MKRVLVTGGSGFVGANLTRRLLADGHDVHLLLRPEYDSWRLETIQGDVQVHYTDLGDPACVARIVSNVRPDWVFHLAAYGAYPSQSDLSRMIQTNLTGTVNLVQSCLATGFEAFVHAGSSSEYGFKDHPAGEEELIEPNSHYAVTKAAATLFCQYSARRANANLGILRLYSVYGPLEEPTRLVPALILHGLRGELPPLADPATARDFVFVDDVVDAFIQAASHSDRIQACIFNVGTGVQTTLRELVEVARVKLAIAVAPRWGTLEGRSWDTPCWVADSRRLRESLDWQPRHTVQSGFGRFVEWIRDNPLRELYYRTRRTDAR
jgi:dolichol-phosphate mannosyltransferase